MEIASSSVNNAINARQDDLTAYDQQPPFLKNKRSKKSKKPENELIKIFWEAPCDAFFRENVIAPVLGCSIKTLQCDRWKKSGIPFRKLTGRVLYRKSDVLAFLEAHAPITSTSEYQRKG